MVKLPISETALKYYEEAGYKFSWKEQAHFCFRVTPGLLKRVDSLKEILEKSDDEKLNRDIRMMVDYEYEAYSKFMENENGRHVYVLKINEYDGRTLTRYFRTAQQAMSCHKANVNFTFQINEIKKVLHNLFPATFKFNADGEVIDYSSTECESDYDFDIFEFESRFDNIFLKIDCPFERGDIVMSPEFSYPLIVLADRDIFHKKYEATKSQYGDLARRMLDYEHNRIPVLDCYNSLLHPFHHKSFFYDEDYKNELSIVYRRPFQMERIDHNKGYSEDFWNVILDASKMVKCRYDMDAVEIGIYNAMEGD
jgi:hypothetical protein